MRKHPKIKEWMYSQQDVLQKDHFLNRQYNEVYCFGLLKSEWYEMNSQNLLEGKNSEKQ